MSRKDIIASKEHGNRAEAFEAFADIPTHPNLGNTIGDVIARRYGRRDFLRGSLAVTASTALFGTTALTTPNRAAAATADDSRYIFSELTWGNDEKHHIADGYNADILVRWGDPITADAPDFDVMNQTPEAQSQQFGYNNAYVGIGELEPGRGMLCVNHEYTNEEVMFPGLGRQDKADFEGMTKELVDIEMAAHGGAVFEIVKQENGKWSVNRDNRANRRVTANTHMTFYGPAAVHDRMKTSVDTAGMEVLGTINNCAGGMTPWGTYLMAEENFHGYFWTDVVDSEGDPDVSAQADGEKMKRYGVPGKWYAWGKYHDRFNIDKEPNEPNRFGWNDEVDPMNPAENGFNDQGDVMIDARIAGDLLGATPMDRPEDAQPRGDGTAYIMLTNNSRREPDQLDAANPRPESRIGHIIELKEEGGNHSAAKGTWSLRRWARCGTQKPRKTAGSDLQTIAPSTMPGASGFRPIRVRAGVGPASLTGFMRWKPKAICAVIPNCSSAVRTVVNSAVLTSLTRTRR